MSKNTARIEDFGAKIGGARKDLYAYESFTDEEKAKLIKRDAIWKKPDYAALIKSGLDDGVAYYQDLVRKSVSPKPGSIKDKAIRDYIDTVTEIRDDVMAFRTREDVEDYYKTTFKPKYLSPMTSFFVSVNEAASEAVSKKTLKAVQTSYQSCKKTAYNSLFGVPKEEEEAEKIRRFFHVVRVDGDKISIEKSYRRECIKQRVTYGCRYYYASGVETLSDKVSIGDYIILEAFDRTQAAILAADGNAFRSKEDADLSYQAMLAAASVMAGVKATPKKAQKKKFKSVCIERVVRSGAPDYIADRKCAMELIPDSTGQITMAFTASAANVTGDDYTSTFGFRGGEFGLWMNERDRQDSLDYGYNALMDLATILNIYPDSISLGHSLAIAFGSRGSGSASAHFEPLRNVINLTKMSGAGCLAHEWCHALDFYIAKKFDMEVGTLASDATSTFAKRKLPESFVTLVESLVIDPKTRKYTEYYKNSRAFGKTFSKSGHGYWESRCEMLARAFDCYVHDKLTAAGIRSDYLSAYSDSFKFGEIVAYPTGDERKRFNRLFDEFFDYLRTDGLI